VWGRGGHPCDGGAGVARAARGHLAVGRMAAEMLRGVEPGPSSAGTRGASWTPPGPGSRLEAGFGAGGAPGVPAGVPIAIALSALGV